MKAKRRKEPVSRRDFLKLAALRIGSLAFRSYAQSIDLPEFPKAALLGRVNGGKVDIKARPDIDNQTVGELYEEQHCGGNRRMKKLLFLSLTGLVLIACGFISPMRWSFRSIPGAPGNWGGFGSTGERIYYTATNEYGVSIPYKGGPAYGGMMMQSRLACVSCHGTDGRGGKHQMHMQIMDAPDIRYVTLEGEMDEHSGENMQHSQAEYNLDMFRQAVLEGKHPDGEALSRDMPRWDMSDEDLAVLFQYLKSLP